MAYKMQTRSNLIVGAGSQQSWTFDFSDYTEDGFEGSVLSHVQVDDADVAGDGTTGNSNIAIRMSGEHRLDGSRIARSILEAV